MPESTANCDLTHIFAACSVVGIFPMTMVRRAFLILKEERPDRDESGLDSTRPARAPITLSVFADPGIKTAAYVRILLCKLTSTNNP